MPLLKPDTKMLHLANLSFLLFSVFSASWLTTPRFLVVNLALERLNAPATRASNALTPVSSSTPTQPYQTPGRRPRNAFIIFRDVFLAVNKNMLPRQQTEVSAIAGAVWRGLSDEKQLIYQTLARLEREAYERGNPAPASQRRVSAAGGSGSRNSRGHRMIPSQSAVNVLHGPGAQDMDAQAFLYRAPTIAPAAASEMPRIQDPISFMMNGNTDKVLHDVHTTQGQGMIDVHHGQATQGLQTSHQWPASASIRTAIAETSVSDSQIPNPVSYYRDTSGQSFAIMNQTAIPQYLPSAPIVAPIARHPNLVATSFTHHQLGGNIYNQGWGEPLASHASASSSVGVGSSSLEVGLPNHGGGSSIYYEHPPENTWDGSQYRQHQLWSSGYSGQPS
ncbi:uncharacterized protein ARMOST_12432 [Armillaria ostoyae]|uniref:HMG box domain-containing protein n=1 Tax=Armillaria ostoyae TaxID=47428 RepID=A0A284RJX9_ARMOS|nr:uncharacterized protein ARMOST_12432 [Armillaria ostoyae]